MSAFFLSFLLAASGWCEVTTALDVQLREIRAKLSGNAY